MKNKYRQFLYRRTLRWVNRMRARWGDTFDLPDLPVGIRGNGQACPLKNAMAPVVHGVAGTYYSTDSGQHGLPWYVVAFIERFDKGEYPNLSLTWAELREFESMMREATRVPDPVEPVSASQDEEEYALSAS